MMESIWLEDFIALAEHKNFSRAAEARFVTQPAFSRRIKAFEEWLEVPLFQRSTHGVQMTKMGEEMLPVAQDLVRRYGQFKTRAQEVAAKERNLLQFAATYTLSFSFFPKWIRSLDSHALFEAIKLTTNTMVVCEEMLRSGEVDFLICHGHPLVKDQLSEDFFSKKKVGRDQLVLVCGMGFDLAQCSNQRVPFLRYSDESSLWRIIDFSIPLMANLPNLDIVFESHLSPVLLSMVIENKGIAWLPESIVEQEILNGRLKQIEKEKFSIPLEIRLHRPKESLGAFSEAFWDSIEEC